MASKHKSGEEIRFAVGKSSLGLILVASSDEGLVAVLMGDDEHLLIEDLQHRFPLARLERGDRTEDEQHLRRVLDVAETPSLRLDLPLDVRETEFQRKVWKALREIPLGETSSFKEIACKIGTSKAMRAVGNACSNNNLAIVIPCHRVRHHDGSLSAGYRWGDERQRMLLEREMRLARSSKDPNMRHFSNREPLR